MNHSKVQSALTSTASFVNLNFYGNPTISAEDMSLLTKVVSMNQKNREILVSDPTHPEDFVLQLLKIIFQPQFTSLEQRSLKRSIATNPKLPNKGFWTLVVVKRTMKLDASDNELIRIVSENLSCPLDLKNFILEKHKYHARTMISIAENHVWPQSIFEKLATSKFRTVRKAINYNKNCDNRIKQQFKDDRDSCVKIAFIESGSPTDEVMTHLLSTDDPQILDACGNALGQLHLHHIQSNDKFIILLPHITNVKAVVNFVSNKPRSIKTFHNIISQLHLYLSRDITTLFYCPSEIKYVAAKFRLTLIEKYIEANKLLSSKDISFKLEREELNWAASASLFPLWFTFYLLQQSSDSMGWHDGLPNRYFKGCKQSPYIDRVHELFMRVLNETQNSEALILKMIRMDLLTTEFIESLKHKLRDSSDPNIRAAYYSLSLNSELESLNIIQIFSSNWRKISTSETDAICRAAITSLSLSSKGIEDALRFCLPKHLRSQLLYHTNIKISTLESLFKKRNELGRLAREALEIIDPMNKKLCKTSTLEKRKASKEKMKFIPKTIDSHKHFEEIH